MNDSGHVVGISGSARSAYGLAGAAVGDQGDPFTHRNTEFHRAADNPQSTRLFQIEDLLPPDIDRRPILSPPLARTARFESQLQAVVREGR